MIATYNYVIHVTAMIWLPTTCVQGDHVLFPGNVTNTSFENEIFGRTNGSYFTVTVTYDFRSRGVRDYNHSSIVYIQSEGDRARYIGHECFTRSLNEAFYDWSTDVISIYPHNTAPYGTDHKCYVNDVNYTVCQGTLQMAMGYASRFWVTAGCACDFRHTLD